jgi:hypothetical protein
MKHVLVASLLSMSTLLACQGQQKPGDLQADQAVDGSEEAHSTEAIIGPDEAFFAQVYVQDLFRFSHENAEPKLDASGPLALHDKTGNAFDYGANFSASRLDLMVRGLFASGDADGDRQLSEEEFAGVRFDPALYGAQGEPIAHRYSRRVFSDLAGDDGMLTAAELQDGLRMLGSALKAYVDRQSPHEQRLSLIRAWRGVLQRYDADRDGDLNLSEQRQLRSERAQLMKQLPDL